MKKFIIALIMTSGLLACSSLEDNIRLFESEKLVGVYDVDMSPLLGELKPTDEDDRWARLGKGLASMALSNMDMTMKFYPGNKCDMEFTGDLFSWFQAPSDSNKVPTASFTYKVVQDSLLYMKGEQDENFERWGIVRKFNDDYSALQFVVFNEDDEDNKQVLFHLKRVQK